MHDLWRQSIEVERENREILRERQEEYRRWSLRHDLEAMDGATAGLTKATMIELAALAFAVLLALPHFMH